MKRVSKIERTLDYYEAQERERLAKEHCKARQRSGCPVHGDKFIAFRQAALRVKA